MTTPKPPSGLGPDGRRLWRSALAEFELSADTLILLTQACRAADSCERLAKLAAAEEPVITGRLGQRLANPIFAELRAERRVLMAAIAAVRHEPVTDDPGAIDDVFGALAATLGQPE